MSFNSDMQRAELHTKAITRSTRSGAVVETWCKKADVLVSIYEVSAFQVVNTQRYTEVSHRGITYARGLERGQKLIADGREFEILQVAQGHLKTTLFLREVTEDGG